MSDMGDRAKELVDVAALIPEHFPPACCAVVLGDSFTTRTAGRPSENQIGGGLSAPGARPPLATQVRRPHRPAGRHFEKAAA